MSTTKAVLPDNDTVEQVFKALETETTALFENLDLSFLMDLPVFAPNSRGRTRVHEPPELLKGVLHCFYNDIVAEDIFIKLLFLETADHYGCELSDRRVIQKRPIIHIKDETANPLINATNRKIATHRRALSGRYGISLG